MFLKIFIVILFDSVVKNDLDKAEKEPMPVVNQHILKCYNL